MYDRSQIKLKFKALNSTQRGFIIIIIVFFLRKGLRGRISTEMAELPHWAVGCGFPFM
jgi:hypothetical protein